MKIRSKLIVYFLVISLIPLIIIGIFNYISAEQLLKKEILNTFENIATHGEKKIENVIEENLEKIKLISTILQLKIELDKYNNNIDRNKSQVSMNNILNPIKLVNKNFEEYLYVTNWHCFTFYKDIFIYLASKVILQLFLLVKNYTFLCNLLLSTVVGCLLLLVRVSGLIASCIIFCCATVIGIPLLLVQ